MPRSDPVPQRANPKSSIEPLRQLSQRDEQVLRMGSNGDDSLLFDDAADYVGAQVTARNAAFNNTTMLTLYALYKQATVGACNIKKPGVFDQAGRSKWDAWSKLGSMPCEQAKEEYVRLVTKISPEWEAQDGTQAGSSSAAGGTKKSGMGPVFSAFSMQDETVSVSGDYILQVMGDQVSCLQDNDCRSIQELAAMGDCQGMLELLAAGTSVDEPDHAGGTALHFASDRGCLQVMQLLLDNGANVNSRDEDGQTPLHYAALCGHEEVEFGVDQGHQGPSADPLHLSDPCSLGMQAAVEPRR